MRIKDTQITISSKILPAPGGLPEREIDQDAYRGFISACLRSAIKEKREVLEIPALDSRYPEFPVAGAAKIIVQELLRASKDEQNRLKAVSVCVEDEKRKAEFVKTFEGYLRHLLDNLGPGPYITVDIIIELEEGIILIERSNPPYGWALPGGFLDYGESLEEAAAREAREETNMELEDLRQFHTYSEPGRDPRFQTVSTVFIAKGKGEPQFGDDAKGLKVVSCDELLGLDYAFDHKKIIKDYLSRR